MFKGYDSESGCEVAWNAIKLEKSAASKTNRSVYTYLHTYTLATCVFSGERSRIVEEISQLKEIKHRNIIGIIDAWINKAKSEVVFITELVAGCSLKR